MEFPINYIRDDATGSIKMHPSCEPVPDGWVIAGEYDHLRPIGFSNAEIKALEILAKTKELVSAYPNDTVVFQLGRLVREALSLLPRTAG